MFDHDRFKERYYLYKWDEVDEEMSESYNPDLYKKINDWFKYHDEVMEKLKSL